MSDMQAPMTALEFCFEDELSHVPGWRSEFLEMEHPHDSQESFETEEEGPVEQAMMLGN